MTAQACTHDDTGITPSGIEVCPWCVSAEMAELTRERDEARQALARLRAEFTDCCACRSNEAGDIQVWCRAHADIRDECDRLRVLLREVTLAVADGESNLFDVVTVDVPVTVWKQILVALEGR